MVLELAPDGRARGPELVKTLTQVTTKTDSFPDLVQSHVQLLLNSGSVDQSGRSKAAKSIAVVLLAKR